jgi:hypothetical protein
LTDEESLQGNTTVSIETTESETEKFVGYVREHPDKFLEVIRRLKPADQDMLLAYYMIGSKQNSLARLFSNFAGSGNGAGTRCTRITRSSSKMDCNRASICLLMVSPCL